MPGFHVEADLLGSYGWAINSDGLDAAEIGPYCRQYAGQTDGLTGLLDEIRATIDGYGAEGVAYAFSTHYADLANVYKNTGTGLQNTAKLYARSDAKTRQILDGKAPAVGSGVDVAYDDKSQLSWTTQAMVPTRPDPDPTKSARDGMAIDVKAIDWLFHQATGHHITEPIDAFIGNWTTLTADGAAWGMVGDAWTQCSQNLTGFAGQIDHIWDGNAAQTFQEYASRLAGGMKGEAEVALGLKAVLDKLASSFEDTFNQVLGLIQSVIHQVESAMVLLAASWWTGIGDVLAAHRAYEAVKDFSQAWKIINLLLKIVKWAGRAMRAYYAIKSLISAITGGIESKIDDIKTAISLVGAGPGILDDLRHLPNEPTLSYGGPSAPGIS